MLVSYGFLSYYFPCKEGVSQPTSQMRTLKKGDDLLAIGQLGVRVNVGSSLFFNARIRDVGCETPSLHGK